MKNVSVHLNGISPLMYNAFRGQEAIPPERKIHLGQDGKTVILPATSIIGFLSSTMVGRSCVNTFIDVRKRSDVKADVLASVAILEMEIPILGDKGPLVFDGFNGRIRVDERPAQASKTSRDIVKRPVVSLPWGMKFHLLLNESKYITEQRMHDWFVDGGMAVGLGAFRPFFGKFEVVSWEVTK